MYVQVVISVHMGKKRNNGTIFLCREISTIIRSLGCVPSEAELQDILSEVSME